MANKETYRHWVSKGLMDSYYHTFKSFKVYWAYRYYIAKQLDKEGQVIDINSKFGRPNTIKYSNHASKYE